MDNSFGNMQKDVKGNVLKTWNLQKLNISNVYITEDFS